MISDDQNDQTVTSEAFDLLHYIAGKRLAAGKLTVVDATSVQQQSRAPLVQLAKRYHCLPVAIVLNPPEKVCRERNEARPDRQFGPHVIQNQRSQLRRSVKRLKKEGFRYVYILNSVDDIDAATIERTPLWNDKRDEHGPFDFIGDVHGCCDELEELLSQLGYQRSELETECPIPQFVYSHPEGRKAVFVGDLVDRGPRNLDSAFLVRNMISSGSAISVPGNHDDKFLRYLRGNLVKISHGLATTVAELEAIPKEQREVVTRELSEFIEGLVSHYVLHDGKLVVAHAGMKQKYQGRGSKRIRDYALYGETTGELDENGLPERLKWAQDYRGEALVVYGHTPVQEPEWLNNTVNIDTGCVFGGCLTALRYPEMETVSVDAKRVYWESARLDRLKHKKYSLNIVQM